ncbi:hypothetical protein RhiirA4_470941 [Rhizophagus irregularis]|uniref:Uncharacterized protein n=1 Tax=Rhizophagus irregularis TaxID=588596 RepID=A0A2I1H267_9GLOM|nr:hypothetical protein RhiirA4_470941 [Rhizophagus irregularis]
MKKLEEIQDLIDKLGLENPLIADEFVKCNDGSTIIENAKMNIIDNSQNFLEFWMMTNITISKLKSVLLNYRSPYLRRKLSTNIKNNDGTLAHIFMAESLIKIDPLDIIELLIAANELRIPISIKNFSEK